MVSLCVACSLLFAGGLSIAIANVTIRVVDIDGWELTEPLWKGLPEFERKTGIKVELVRFPFAEILRKQIMTLRAQPSRYDVVVSSEAMSPQLYKFTLPLDDLLETENIDPVEWKQRFFEAAIASHSFGGKTYFYPNCGSTQIGIYRKQLFEDPQEQQKFKNLFGYNLHPPKTIQELLDIAEFFTRDLNGDGRTDLWGLVFAGKWGPGESILVDQILRAGLGYTDDQFHCMWGPSHPAYQRIVKDIAQFQQDLIFKYKVVPPGVVSMGNVEMPQVYMAGNAAMAMGWLESVYMEGNKPEFISKFGSTGSFVIPGRSQYWGGFFGGWGWGINKASVHQEAAWEFIKYFTDVEVLKKFTPPYPVNKELTKYMAEKGLVPAAHFDGEERIPRTWHAFPELSRVRDVVREYNEKLLSGQITAEEFVRITGEKIEQYIKEAGYFD